MSGHGSADPEHVCACDVHPARCPCACYGRRCRALDADIRAALGMLYRLTVAARAVVWVLDKANAALGGSEEGET